MRLKDKVFLAVAGFLPVPAIAQDVPPPASPSPYVSHDRVDYDEVGHAVGYQDETGVTAAHASLPVSGFAEVTNLDTGRTILVLVKDRSVPAGELIALSPKALAQLGVDGSARFPVRVRRTNPPQHEKTALNNGGQAAERLETPPALLNALRKKLAGQAPAPTPVAAPPPPVKPAKAAKPVAAKPPAPAPKPVAAKPPPSTPAPAATGRHFIQVAALSSEARAQTLAKSLGGSVVASGKVWRVRTGPYASDAAARAALGPIRAKGYRDARITR